LALVLLVPYVQKTVLGQALIGALRMSFWLSYSLPSEFLKTGWRSVERFYLSLFPGSLPLPGSTTILAIH